MLAGAFSLAWMNQLAHLLKEACDWRIIALARAVLALLFALALARLAGAKLVLWRPAALWLRGAASSLSLLCLFFALTRLPTAEAITLSNTVPIWVAFLSWPLLGAAPTGTVWLAALAGSAGVALMQWPHLSQGMGASWASGLALTAAFTSAVAMLGLNRLRALHPLAVVVHYSAFATVVVGAACAVSPPSFAVLAQPSAILLLLGVGATATFGQLCVTRAFTLGEPARVAVVGLTQIVFALALDTAFSGQLPQLSTVAGILLVLAPTAWVTASRAAPLPATEATEAKAA